MNDHRTEQRFLPYSQAFQTMKRWRTVATYLLYAISVISIGIPVLNQRSTTPVIATTLAIAYYFNYLFIVSYYVVNVVTEVFLYPAAARQRRLNLIDNSLGSRFLGQDSQGYFSNDIIPISPYKLCVNCFENCFFTYNLAKGMYKAVITKNAAFALVFLSLAYVGIKSNSVGLPILQIFLSALFLTDLIHHLNFTSKLSILFERFKQFFMEATTNLSIKDALHYPVALLMDYETTLAYNKGPMSDRVYNAMKKKLSEEWEQMKIYYKILG